MCVFCHKDEVYICSDRFQKLLLFSLSQRKAAYSMTIELGREDKAGVLNGFIEEKNHFKQTGNDKSDMVRERPLRTVRPARGRVRA